MCKKRGKVKWFNDDKGFGFITSEDGVDAFVHIKAVDDEAALVEGAAVEYETETGPKGLRAKSVRLVAMLLLAACLAVMSIADCGFFGIGIADCQAGEASPAAAPASSQPATGYGLPATAVSQPAPTGQATGYQEKPATDEMIDFSAMLGSPWMIVIVTGALVQLVKKKAAETPLLARVPIWCYATLIAGGLTALATYGLGTLQGAFWPLMVNIVANVLWTLGGYGLLMGLTKTPATAAAGGMGRETKAKRQAVRGGAGWARLIVLAAAMAATCGGCAGMSNGQKYLIASQSYTSTANVLAVLVRAGEFTTADKKQIKALSDEADKLLDEMRADLLAEPPAAMNFTYLTIKINALLDELLRMQLAAEAAKAKAKAVTHAGTDGNPAGDQDRNRDAHAAGDGGGGDPTDRASTDAGRDRRGDLAAEVREGQPRRGPCRDGNPIPLTALIVEAEWD